MLNLKLNLIALFSFLLLSGALAAPFNPQPDPPGAKPFNPQPDPPGFNPQPDPPGRV